MTETSGVFFTPEVDPGRPETLDFLRHALHFGYAERQEGDVLYIEGGIGVQEKVQDVERQVSEAFEKVDNAQIYNVCDEDGNECRLSIVFDEPKANGVRVIEIKIKQSE